VDTSAGASGRNLPPPSRASSSTDAAGSARPPRRGRKILIIGAGVVVVALVIGILVLTLGGGDGTKATANPLEVRQLVATFGCTSSNPGTPSDVKVTAGQEVVRLGRGGCAVVGPVIDKVDRATKISTMKTDNGCTVTFQSTSKYGAIVNRASVVNNGYARALVGGGYLLDLRAILYPPTSSSKLSVVFSASDQSACDTVANALRRT
jgi:hypothetical protein